MISPEDRESPARELVVQIRESGYVVDWQEAAQPLSAAACAQQADFYAAFAEDRFEALMALGANDVATDVPVAMQFLHRLGQAFWQALATTPDLERLREKAVVELPAEVCGRLVSEAPFMLGSEYLSEAWVGEEWRALNQAFSRRIAGSADPVAAYFSAHHTGRQPVGRVFFHLVEAKDERQPFAFLATYSSAAGLDGKTKHVPLRHALVEYEHDESKLLELLATVYRAKEHSPFIAELVESGEIFQPLGLTSSEAYGFLKEIPLYEAAGILCRIPKWWRRKSDGVRVRVNLGEKASTRLGSKALVDFDVTVALGDQTLSPQEVRELLRADEGLALIKGKWMEVDHAQLQAILEAYEALHDHNPLTLREVLQWNLGNATRASNLTEVEVSHGQWLATVLASLRQPERLGAVSLGADFKARLREYQTRGVAWLDYMQTLGLGACLADDMGLGKTVQVIAFLNHLREQAGLKALLIVPASLIGNWVDEVERFAPRLRIGVLHPSVARPGAAPDDEAPDLWVTTYTMLAKYAWVMDASWDVVILDEAQAIKNPGTRQAKAVKHLNTRHKIALTGTPIENRLSDLWSLFDFLNPGLLGNRTEFGRFVKRLASEPEGYGRLRQVVGPFILRRLKTDPTVISDLPDKIEMKTYASLSKRQAALYADVVRDVQQRLDTVEGMERRGLVLASLLKLKQICNHPDQYLGQSLYTEEDSGKLMRLKEIAQIVYAKRERMLVFTQFREMTDPLQAFLSQVFEHPGLVLHGQTPVRERRDLVTKFQGAEYVPFMVLSIKAGGVGLNLTQANHVVHFDRWWNPAVENQATDRAFRIGQQKNVIVHKFIVQGTIEEKIDALIEEKIQLSQDIVPTMQETWITELDREQLQALFSLAG